MKNALTFRDGGLRGAGLQTRPTILATFVPFVSSWLKIRERPSNQFGRIRPIPAYSGLLKTPSPGGAGGRAGQQQAMSGHVGLCQVILRKKRLFIFYGDLAAPPSDAPCRRGMDAAQRRPSPWPRTSQRDVPAIGPDGVEVNISIYN